MIRVRDLSLVQAGAARLQDVVLDVPAGAVVGLLGPLGAGKTTLLRVLATIDTPTGGDAWIAGRSIRADPAAVRRRIGYAPQLDAAFGSLRVVDYLEFLARAHRVPPRAMPERLEWVLAQAGLDDAAGKPMQALDREGRRRLTVAAAAIHEPPVLLLDEPGTGLDLHARARMGRSIRALAAPDRAVLVASNIMADLAGACDAVGVMACGRIWVEGTARALAPSLSGARILELRPTPGTDVPALVGYLQTQPGVLRADAAPRGPTVLAWIAFDLPDAAAWLDELAAAGAPIEAARELEIALEALMETGPLPIDLAPEPRIL